MRDLDERTDQKKTTKKILEYWSSTYGMEDLIRDEDLSYLLSLRKGRVISTPSNAWLIPTYNAAERRHTVTVSGKQCGIIRHLERHGFCGFDRSMFRPPKVPVSYREHRFSKVTKRGLRAIETVRRLGLKSVCLDPVVADGGWHGKQKWQGQRQESEVTCQRPFLIAAKLPAIQSRSPAFTPVSGTFE